MTFLERHAAAFQRSFYRPAGDRLLSSIGIGTYLGDANAETDSSYVSAILRAVEGGINVIDTAINYRGGRSEMNAGVAITQLTTSGSARREDLLVCTKAGFLTPGLIPEGLDSRQVAGGMHCMEPGFLEDQVFRSLRHLQTDYLDVHYLHNPETQLRFVSRQIFERRLLAAFERLESLCAKGLISFYGTATWNGYRLPPGHAEGLSLERVVELAHQVGGDGHHFRFIQLPYNLAMPEAFTSNHLLETASHAGISVIASASILQGRLSKGLPDSLKSRFSGPTTDAQFALQFTRSAPGITTALVGMSRVEHVDENLILALFPPMPVETYTGLFRGAQ